MLAHMGTRHEKELRRRRRLRKADARQSARMQRKNLSNTRGWRWARVAICTFGLGYVIYCIVTGEPLPSRSGWFTGE